MKSHVGFWIVAWIIVLLAVPFFMSAEHQVERIRVEVDDVTAAFGYDKTEDLVNTATSIYSHIFIDSGWLTKENPLYAKSRRGGGSYIPGVSTSVSAFAKATNSYFISFSINVFGVLLRWGVMLHWLVFIFPFLAAAFVDGFVTRKVKLSSFGFISPMAYSLALHSIIMMAAIPMIYLIAPLPLSPYFMPVWALVASLPIILMVSNTQRLFNA